MDLLEELARTNPTQRPAIAAAVLQLKNDEDPAVRIAGVRCLSSMGGVHYGLLLTEFFADQDLRVVNKAISYVSWQRHEGLALHQKLGELLRDNRLQVRICAAAALSGIGRPAADQSENLRLALTDPNLEVRMYSIRALRQFGEEARTAVPDLIALLTHENANLRTSAHSALMDLGDLSEEWTAELGALLKHDEASVRRDSAEVLGRTGPMARFEAGRLVELLTDGDSEVRHAAARALMNLENHIKEQRPKLLKLLKHRDPGARLQAISVLSKPGMQSRDNAAPLAELLKADHKWERLAALNALADLGANARPFHSLITKLLQDPETEIRIAALSALRKLRLPSDALRTALIALLEDPDRMIRKQAFNTLGYSGPLDAALQDRLLAYATDEDSRVSTEAATVLVRLSRAARERLLDSVNSENETPLLLHDVTRLLAQDIHEQNPEALDWLMDVLGSMKSPMASAEIEQHLDEPNLDLIGPKLLLISDYNPYETLSQFDRVPYEPAIVLKVLAYCQAYPLHAAKLRFSAHFLGGSLPNNQVLIKWLGDPKFHPDPAEDVDGAEVFLRTLCFAWEASVGSDEHTQRLLKRQITPRASAIVTAGKWNTSHRRLLERLLMLVEDGPDAQAIRDVVAKLE